MVFVFIPFTMLLVIALVLIFKTSGRYKTQVTGHRAQGTGHRAQVTGHRAQGTGYRAQGTGHRS